MVLDMAEDAATVVDDKACCNLETRTLFLPVD